MPGSVWSLCFSQACLEIWPFHSHQVYMPGKRTYVCSKPAKDKRVHLHIFDRVRLIKPP